MRTYEVELRRTSYITLTVVADNEDEAEEKVWEEVGLRADLRDAEWVVESIEEVHP